VEQIDTISEEISLQLMSDIYDYLYDAGFPKDHYLIEDFNYERGYIEVYFINFVAIDFIMLDIKKTPFDNFLEIKKYKYEDKFYSAIFAYR